MCIILYVGHEAVERSGVGGVKGVLECRGFFFLFFFSATSAATLSVSSSLPVRVEYPSIGALIK